MERRKRRTCYCVWSVVSVVLSLQMLAQAPSEKVLLPIFFDHQVEGAHGSIWKSELAITNRGLTTLEIGGIFSSCSVQPCDFPIPRPAPRLVPEGTIFPRPASPFAFPPTSFLFVEPGRLDDLALSLRIQDISRQALTWGTEIPAVRESDAFTLRADLNNVPVDERFRVLLRIYDFEPGPDHRARITGYKINPKFVEPRSDLPGYTVAFETERELIPYGPSTNPDTLPHAVPGYAQMDLSEVTFVTNNVQSLRIRIEPSGGTTRYWAFISVTNNETQHVTTITPY